VKSSTEAVVERLEAHIKLQDYASFMAALDSVPEFADFDEPTKELAKNCLRVMILTRVAVPGVAHSLYDNGLDEGLEQIGIFEVAPAGSEGKYRVAVGETEAVSYLDGAAELSSFAMLVNVHLYESGNEFLGNLLELWETGYWAADFLDALEQDPAFFERTKRWCWGVIRGEAPELDDFEYLISPEESFYAGAASFSLYNFNVVSQAQFEAPCNSCGESFIVCKSAPCKRSYFSALTGFDCSVDVVGYPNWEAESEEFETILIYVSELGDDHDALMSWRVPKIEGIFILYRNDQDGEVRFLLGDRDIEDWEASSMQTNTYEFESFSDFGSYFSEATHPQLVEGEYLVVSWRTTPETGSETALLWGLYRGDARNSMEQILR
jgi:hypothetical protein